MTLLNVTVALCLNSVAQGIQWRRQQRRVESDRHHHHLCVRRSGVDCADCCHLLLLWSQEGSRRQKDAIGNTVIVLNSSVSLHAMRILTLLHHYHFVFVFVSQLFCENNRRL